MKQYDPEQARKDAIKGILEDALTRLPPQAVVTFRRHPNDSVQVCGMEMRDNGHESVRYIPQERIGPETMMFLGLRDNLPLGTKVQLSQGLEVPAPQLDEVVRSILRVGIYDGPLPFYADVFYRIDPILSN